MGLTQGHGDVGTWGLRDVGREHAQGLEDVGRRDWRTGELFCTQSSHSKMGKAAPWMLEIITYWSADKLSSIYYLSLDHRKLYLTNSAQKSADVCLSHPPVPMSYVPASPSPTSHFPHPQVPVSLSVTALMSLL